MKLAIFCTGGTKLGFGHFFRSRTFAKAAPDGTQVLLLPVVEEQDKHFFREIADATFLCSDEEGALAAIDRFSPDVVVFDTVYCSDPFFTAARKRSRLIVSISPVFNHMERVDYLFTRNFHALQMGSVGIYKGLEFAVFNEHCDVIPDDVYAHHILRPYLTIGVAMGGGDAPNKTLRVLQAISRVDVPCTFWVLLGEGYRHSYQDLVDTIRRDSNHEIILAKTNRSMWNVLSNCTIAILAGGLTTIEAIHAGLPSLNIFEKPDHVVAMGREVFDLGIAEDMGLFGEGALQQLADRVRYLSANRDVLLSMRKNSKGKVDQLGPARIYKRIAQIVREGYV
ncbi:MAG TPA: hypothetical protein VK658_24215 [Chryseolinea sp.]|nr:hypothetical protein [Chryseolinea sp.]